MLCPVCKDPMIVLELEQIEVDFCTGCDGVWLDAGELELLLETDEERNRLVNLFKEAGEVKEKSYDCPICGKHMKKFEIGDKNKVVVDKCRKSHGIWFDRGELKKVVEFGSVNKENKIINLLKDMFENSSQNNGGSK
ncbi:MAG: zf-TFIIB domain-containing protein [Ignavibacteriaceae bacterium]|nr:zf-TFIIB domain-containing protein [Ignavibacteriaceae bacterium]